MAFMAIFGFYHFLVKTCKNVIGCGNYSSLETTQRRKLFAEIQYLKKLVGYLHLTSTTEQTCNLEWAFVSQNIGNSEILGVPNSVSPGNPGKYCSLAIPITITY